MQCPPNDGNWRYNGPMGDSKETINHGVDNESAAVSSLFRRLSPAHRITAGLLKRYAIQCGLATGVVLIDWTAVMSPHAGIIIFGALATGLGMFLMVLTKTEHPPCRRTFPGDRAKRVGPIDTDRGYGRGYRLEHHQAIDPADIDGSLKGGKPHVDGPPLCIDHGRR